MSIQSFRIKGRSGRILLSGKKQVLSNKSLTSRVRALTGMEGSRQQLSENLYAGVTLTADTSDINYLDEMNAKDNDTLHRIRFFINIKSPVDGASRVIFFQDSEANVTEATSASILATNSVFAGYQENDTLHPFSAKSNNKNLLDKPRFRIIKDMYFAHTLSGANETIARLVDIPLHGKKGDSLTSYGMLVISLGASLVNIWYTLDFTDLAN